MAIQIAQDAHADQVLSESSFALLCGMLLDQQFPMERAFAGPAKVLDRFGSLDPAEIAAADPEQFAALCATPPAVHRYPGSMAARIQALAAHVVAGVRRRHGAAVARGRRRPRPARAASRRCRASASRRPRSSWPSSASSSGSGPTAGSRPPAATPRQGSFRSVADVVDATSLEKVRAFKKEKKAAARTASSGS